MILLAQGKKQAEIAKALGRSSDESPNDFYQNH